MPANLRTVLTEEEDAKNPTITKDKRRTRSRKSGSRKLNGRKEKWNIRYTEKK